MSLDVAPLPRPGWGRVPDPQANGVESKGLLAQEDLFLALLRFAENATIHEHTAPHEITAICLEGRGFTSVGSESAPLHAGERVVWPVNTPHRLWTENSTMVTLMVERTA